MLVLAKAGVGAPFTHMRQPVRMHESPVGNENVAFGDRHAVALLATFLIGQRKKAEPFGGEIESGSERLS